MPADALEPQLRKRRVAILAALWLFILAVLLVFRSVVLPFAASALVAYVMAPLVQRLGAIRVGRGYLPRWTAVLIVYALFFFGVYLFFVALVPQLYREVTRVTRDALDYANSLTPERIQRWAQTAETWLTQHGLPVSLSRRALEGEESGGALNLTLDLEQVIHQAALRASSALKENLGSVITLSKNIMFGVIAGVLGLFLMLMLAAFFSIDANKIRGYFRSLIPVEYARDARSLIDRIDRSLAGVVRGQLAICLVNGTLTFIGLLLFGVRFAFLLAAVATLFALIPVFGTFISSVPIVLIAVSQSWQKGLAALLWILGVHALEAYFLNPKIMGSAARVHPVVMAFALIAGEHTYGLVGALLAAPFAAIAVACFEFARQKAQPGPNPL